MAEIVTKWAADFDWNRKVVVASGLFRQTAETLVFQDGQSDSPIQGVLRYKRSFPRDSPVLHDTREGALRALLDFLADEIREREEDIETSRCCQQQIFQLLRGGADA